MVRAKFRQEATIAIKRELAADVAGKGWLGETIGRLAAEMPGIMSKSDRLAYERRVQRLVEERLRKAEAEGLFEKEHPISTYSLRTRLQEIWNETSGNIKKLTKEMKQSENSLRQWWENVRGAAQPAIDAIKTLGEQTLGVLGFRKKPEVLTETVPGKEKEKVAKDVFDIEAAYRHLFGEMGRMTEQNYQYQIGILQQLKEKYLQHGMDKLAVEQWFTEQVRKLEIERLKASDNFFDGVKAAQLDNAFSNMILNAKNFSDAVTGFLKSIASSMVQIMSMQIATSLMTGVGMLHSGGIVGAGTTERKVPEILFSNAPRLHAGLQPDEFLAILKRGETVIPENGRSAVNREPPKVIINNNTGQPMEQERAPEFDGENWVVNVIAKNVHQYGSLRTLIQGVK